MNTIEKLLQQYKVKSFKHTSDGLLAIRKGGFWLYFELHNGQYRQTGSTERLQK